MLYDNNGTQESYTFLHWGKFGSQMAHFLWVHTLGGAMQEDDFASNSDIGESATRFGRRVLVCDSQGFVDVDTYATIGEAEQAMVRAHAALDEPDEEEEPEFCDDASHRWFGNHTTDQCPNPYAQPGGLLDEFRQAERLLGDE
jgi:hypothetical protein